MADKTLADVRIEAKVCPDCGKEWPLIREHWKVTSKTGRLRTERCRLCANVVQNGLARARYALDPAPVLAAAKARRDANPEHVLALARATYARIPEDVRKAAKRAAYRRSDPAKEKARSRAKYLKLKQDAETLRKYRQTADRKARSQPVQRLNDAMSGRVWLALKTGKNGRGWQSLVGYTLDALRVHLERQFVRGMTWQNYGTRWHVDHILPVASFRFTTAEDPEFRACWAITNLRPLWKEANLAKQAKRVLLL